jgi:hypothetical protein
MGEVPIPLPKGKKVPAPEDLSPANSTSLKGSCPAKSDHWKVRVIGGGSEDFGPE